MYALIFNGNTLLRSILFSLHFDTLQYYIEKLKVCATASELAQVAMEICNSHESEGKIWQRRFTSSSNVSRDLAFAFMADL